MIRPIVIDELPHLETGAREFYAASRFLGSFDAAKFCETWAALIRAGVGAIFIARETGRIAGAIGGIIRTDLYSPKLVADEAFWFVRPDARGEGVRLYRAFEKWARSSGAEEIQMCHLIDSMPEKVAKFYLHSGFRPAEIRYVKTLAKAAKETAAA